MSGNETAVIAAVVGVAAIYFVTKGSGGGGGPVSSAIGSTSASDVAGLRGTFQGLQSQVSELSAKAQAPAQAINVSVNIPQAAPGAMGQAVTTLQQTRERLQGQVTRLASDTMPALPKLGDAAARRLAELPDSLKPFFDPSTYAPLVEGSDGTGRAQTIIDITMLALPKLGDAAARRLAELPDSLKPFFDPSTYVPLVEGSDGTGRAQTIIDDAQSRALQIIDGAQDQAQTIIDRVTDQATPLLDRIDDERLVFSIPYFASGSFLETKAEEQMLRARRAGQGVAERVTETVEKVKDAAGGGLFGLLGLPDVGVIIGGVRDILLFPIGGGLVSE